MKSRLSFIVSDRSCLVPYTIRCIRIHSTARLRSGGHMQKSGMFLSSNRSIAAIRRRIQSHMMRLLPQSVSRWLKMSIWLHSRHWPIGDRWILWSSLFVGVRSWITLYHCAFKVSGAGVVCMFFHTVGQSVLGYSLPVLIRGGATVTLKRCVIVEYIQRLYAFFFFPHPCEWIYALSSAYCHKYPR
jgi:hypothetical protein